MNREYEFSVVVFAKDTAKLYRTFKNVREVTPEGTVQILAVCIAGDMDIPDERDMRELEEAGESRRSSGSSAQSGCSTAAIFLMAARKPQSRGSRTAAFRTAKRKTCCRKNAAKILKAVGKLPENIEL